MFYRMQLEEEGQPEEPWRARQWVPLDEALRQIPFPQSRELLELADRQVSQNAASSAPVTSRALPVRPVPPPRNPGYGAAFFSRVSSTVFQRADIGVAAAAKAGHGNGHVGMVNLGNRLGLLNDIVRALMSSASASHFQRTNLSLERFLVLSELGPGGFDGSDKSLRGGNAHFVVSFGVMGE
jgi:hypothetical protein